MNAESITSRLHAESDAQLKTGIKDAIDVFKRTLAGLGVSWHGILVPLHKSFVYDEQRYQVKDTPETLLVSLDNVLLRAPEPFFASACEGNRTRAVRVYMEKIERLSAQVGELQQQVEEVRQ